MPIKVRISRRCNKRENRSDGDQPSHPTNLRQVVRLRRNQSVNERVPVVTKIPTIVLSNVRSINNRVDEVEVLLRNHKPDIAVFTETWLDEETPEHAVDVERYVSFRCDTKQFWGWYYLLCF